MPPFSAPPRLVLASASPRRAALLRTLGLAFERRPPHLPETPLPGEAPAGTVERLARAKATAGVVARAQGAAGRGAGTRADPEAGAEEAGGTRTAAAGRPAETLALACDTLVVLGDRVLGKPDSPEEARWMLHLLSGRTHRVLTGVALAGAGQVESGVERVQVRFRPLTDREVREYVATGEPLDKAGAYGIQGLGGTLVRRIEGDHTAVVGLPLHLFQELLGRFGWRYAFGRLAPREEEGLEREEEPRNGPCRPPVGPVEGEGRGIGRRGKGTG